ncbi:NUDIX domain-containing protein [Halovenus sp. WSH3]|uniref:NUDIX domain-containing protein n=1 Tax=Halovenus carboxidivorans TaxID=2692199 RepID=A0A6B0T4J5_9EURY|nr:NUDIX domain-containing protein [Halovenus carboxidivorans]MXR50433.1 NUDIX domain-containing protein [Halovenus carboxidivorans]
MNSMSKWIPDEEWATIVRNVPIVSVDLLIRSEEGIVLGKRTNEPAKGEWFIPGGRVHKGETRTEAVDRIAADELGVEVEIVESLGAFEHIYETAEIGGVGTKHYLANGYVVDPLTDQFQADGQHADFQVFTAAPQSLHQNVRAYIQAAETAELS